MTSKTKEEKFILIKDKKFYQQVMEMYKYVSISKRKVLKQLYKNMIVHKHKGANNWEDKKKSLLKSRSFYDEAQVINKFDNLEIIKLLFLVSRSLEEVMKDSSASVEERAFSRLAENEVISIALKQCKTHYPNVTKATLKELKVLCRKLQGLRQKSPSIINMHSSSFTDRRYLLICAYRLLGGGKKYQSLMKMADDLIKHESDPSEKVENSVVSAEGTSMVGVNQQEVESCQLKLSQCTQEAQPETNSISQNEVSNTKTSEEKGICNSFFEVDEERLAKASLQGTRAAAKQVVRSIAKRNVFNHQVPSIDSPSDFFTDWDSTGRIVMDEPVQDSEIVDEALKNDAFFYDRSKFKAEVQAILRQKRVHKAVTFQRKHNLPPPWAKVVDTTLENPNMQPLGKDLSAATPGSKESKLLKPQYLKKNEED